MCLDTENWHKTDGDDTLGTYRYWDFQWAQSLTIMKYTCINLLTNNSSQREFAKN
jgi:hypothetical protein